MEEKRRTRKKKQKKKKVEVSLPACDPQEEETIVLQDGNVEFSHLVICQRPVRQLHVNVPRRVGHHHCKLPQDGNVQVADVTADPLERSEE